MPGISDQVSQRQLKSLCHRWFEEVWNQQREETIDELLSPDVVIYGVSEEPVGVDGFKQGWRSFLDTFPDIRATVEEIVEDGDRAAIRVSVVGTHLGAGLGVAPSGKKIRFCAHIFCHWKQGVIVKGWNVIDMASAYRQIHGIPLPD